jgi:hypothetical protein
VALLAQSSFQHVPCMRLMFFPIINSIVLQSLSCRGLLTYKRCNKNSLELSSTFTSSCSDKGRDLGFFHISHHNPPCGSGFGMPVSIYCANVGHSFLWCPSILHVVHQMTSRLSLFLFLFNLNVRFFKSSFNSSIVGSVY